MDILLYSTNGRRDETTTCSLNDASLSLILPDRNVASRSALYNSSSPRIRHIMRNQPVAVFNSNNCLRLDNFEESSLSSTWRPFTHNIDREGTLFVSSLEHELLPFYAFAYHPERIAFEWYIACSVIFNTQKIYDFFYRPEKDSIPHSLASLEVSQYLANYFVNEARKSDHQFDSYKDVVGKLIQNYATEFSAKDDSNFFEVYLFEESKKKKYV